MNEGVLFIFNQNGRLLCEEREEEGQTGYYLTGGRCEPEDYQFEDYKRSTLFREVKEELGVQILSYHFIGSYPYKQYLFHACIIDRWKGEIPSKILDNGRPTHWVVASEFIPQISLLPLRQLLEKQRFW